MPKGLLGLDNLSPADNLFPCSNCGERVRYGAHYDNGKPRCLGKEFDELCRDFSIPVQEDYATKKQYDEARREVNEN